MLGLMLANSMILPACASKQSAEPDAVGGPVVMRRLTESQYRASIADIFGPDIPIVGRFEPGLRSDELIAVGTSEAGLSPFSVEQYDASARGIAAAVLSEDKRQKFVPCKSHRDTNFNESCAQQFIATIAYQLFRRPLDDSALLGYVSAARASFDRLNSFNAGLESALSALLVSPEFLLRIERAKPDPERSDRYRLDAWSRATRLSYFLTDSTPDEELLKAAASGELDHTRGVSRQVSRLMATPRFESAIRAFFQDMLHFDRFADLAKDPLIYPAFNSVAAEDAQEQTLKIIIDHLQSRNGDYRELFTTRAAPLTRALGPIYRMPVPPRNGWVQAKFSERSGRAGIQSNISFLALHSHPGRSSPTLRGRAVREIFLCQPVPDPPADVNFSGFNESSTAFKPTARDRLGTHQTEPVCKGCHNLMDPLGLTLEQYDGLGSFRTVENDTPIDVSGALDGNEFVAASGLGDALSKHPQTPRCLVDKIYRAAVGRRMVAVERPFIEFLNQRFAVSGFRVPELMRTIAMSDAFNVVSNPDERQHADKVVKLKKEESFNEEG
ncbi:MAG: DUF1592 domain-containing protein [Pseudomonadales bacterium]